MVYSRASYASYYHRLKSWSISAFRRAPPSWPLPRPTPAPTPNRITYGPPSRIRKERLPGLRHCHWHNSLIWGTASATSPSPAPASSGAKAHRRPAGRSARRRQQVHRPQETAASPAAATSPSCRAATSVCSHRRRKPDHRQPQIDPNRDGMDIDCCRTCASPLHRQLSMTTALPKSSMPRLTTAPPTM